MTDPLPPELKDLVAAERAAPTPDAAARALARARLAKAVGPGGPGATGSAFGAGKVLAILAVVVAAGSLVVLHGRSGPHARANATTAAAPPAPVAESSPAAASTTTGSQAIAPSQMAAVSSEPAPSQTTAVSQETAPPPHARPARSAVANPTVRDPSPPSADHKPAPAPADARTQAELIRNAWSALAVGDPDRALALVRDDDRLHHDGALAEERDAVRIVALARLGRLDEARLAATQFEHDYPSSLHHELVTRALDGTGDPD